MKKFILLVALLLWGVGIGFAETSVDAVASEDDQKNTEYFSLRGRTVDQDIVVYGAMIESEPDDSWWYAHRADCYLVKKDYVKAIEDVCKAIEIDRNSVALIQLSTFPEDQLELIVSNLGKLTPPKEHPGEYLNYIGMIYDSVGKYDKAIESLEEAFEKEGMPAILGDLAEVAAHVGDYASALGYINRAIEISPEDLEYLSIKADILGEMGDSEGAIREWSKFLDSIPDSYIGYYHRGFYEDISGKTEKALADYKKSVKLNPDFVYGYFMMGNVLGRLGKEKAAKKAYRKVIKIETEPWSNVCTMYAYLALGEREKAIDCMNRMIEYDPDDNGTYYDAACLYSRMGDLDKSLEYLQIAFEKGFRRFNQVYSDDNLEALRGRKEFEDLIEEFESKTYRLWQVFLK